MPRHIVLTMLGVCVCGCLCCSHTERVCVFLSLPIPDKYTHLHGSHMTTPLPGQSSERTASQSSGLHTHFSAPAARNCITTITSPTTYAVEPPIMLWMRYKITYTHTHTRRLPLHTSCRAIRRGPYFTALDAHKSSGLR